MCHSDLTFGVFNVHVAFVWPHDFLPILNAVLLCSGQSLALLVRFEIWNLSDNSLVIVFFSKMVSNRQCAQLWFYKSFHLLKWHLSIVSSYSDKLLTCSVCNLWGMFAVWPVWCWFSFTKFGPDFLDSFIGYTAKFGSFRDGFSSLYNFYKSVLFRTRVLYASITNKKRTY